MMEENTISVNISKEAKLELYLPESPYYLKLTLFEHNNKQIGSCGVDPSFRTKLRRNSGDSAKLIAVLTEINAKSPNENLEKLIKQINEQNKTNVEHSFSM